MQKMNKNWQLAGNGLNTALSCDLPMDVFSVLENNNIIPNPYYGRNEYDVRWVGEQDWQLFCSFTPNEDILEKRHQWLSIERLDTCADITLNGNELAQVCNMHTKHIFDVTGKLKDDNMLEITLKDNVAEAAKRAKTLPFPIPYSGGIITKYPI